jgi:hypothetical protein
MIDAGERGGTQSGQGSAGKALLARLLQVW